MYYCGCKTIQARNSSYITPTSDVLPVKKHRVAMSLGTEQVGLLVVTMGKIGFDEINFEKTNEIESLT